MTADPGDGGWGATTVDETPKEVLQGVARTPIRFSGMPWFVKDLAAARRLLGESNCAFDLAGCHQVVAAVVTFCGG